MQQPLYKFVLGLSLIMTLGACNEGSSVVVPEPEPPVGVRAYPNVDEELWPYLTRFEDEALERNVIVDLSAQQLRARLMEIPENGVAGDCQFDENNPNRVRIDATTWRSVSENLREYIVFHELGHCVLIRKHREDADNNGTCLSIMASGTGSCRDAYNAVSRDRLLDELFDPLYYKDWH